TLTTDTNTFAVGDSVTVAGLSHKFFNGTFKITARTDTTISYALKHAEVEETTDAGSAVVTSGIDFSVGNPNAKNHFAVTGVLGTPQVGTTPPVPGLVVENGTLKTLNVVVSSDMN